MSFFAKNQQKNNLTWSGPKWFDVTKDDSVVDQMEDQPSILEEERVTIDLNKAPPIVEQDSEDTVSGEACQRMDKACRTYDPTGVSGVPRLQKPSLTVPVPFQFETQNRLGISSIMEDDDDDDPLLQWRAKKMESKEDGKQFVPKLTKPQPPKLLTEARSKNPNNSFYQSSSETSFVAKSEKASRPTSKYTSTSSRPSSVSSRPSSVSSRPSSVSSRPSSVSSRPSSVSSRPSSVSSRPSSVSSRPSSVSSRPSSVSSRPSSVSSRPSSVSSRPSSVSSRPSSVSSRPSSVSSRPSSVSSRPSSVSSRPSSISTSSHTSSVSSRPSTVSSIVRSRPSISSTAPARPSVTGTQTVPSVPSAQFTVGAEEKPSKKKPKTRKLTSPKSPKLMTTMRGSVRETQQQMSGRKRKFSSEQEEPTPLRNTTNTEGQERRKRPRKSIVPTTTTTTEQQPFNLQTSMRAAHRQTFNEENKKRMEMIKREEARHTEEKERANRREVRQMRKSMVHKACPLDNDRQQQQYKRRVRRVREMALTEPISPHLSTSLRAQVRKANTSTSVSQLDMSIF